jgi:DNA helicase HerA-like ATPase
VLLEKVEQVVRLIRSKGVGVYFVTQSPRDVPDEVLGQLGNRVQHALRAFTPRDQKAVRAAAQTFRPNPRLDAERVITELGVGEALVSTLDSDGRPGIVERTLICPPRSRIGPLSAAEREQVIRESVLFGVFDREVDRESAYEILKSRAESAAAEAARQAPEETSGRRTASRRQSPIEAMIKSAARAIGSQLGRQLIRGVLGSLGGRR